MAARDSSAKRNGRHSILDLAPLELDCLRVLWPMGEGTVRDIRDALEASRPRAYTTIMTIMDRMAQKGIVSRRKAGRAWLYAPNVSAAEARDRAVRRLVEHFFAGSADALMAHLTGEGEAEERVVAPGGAEAASSPRRAAKRSAAGEEPAPMSAPRLDDSLL
ncbi:MAG: BlaI/MecI/CopY family transcriptional regulator [Acidobacteria bacterium]|nr:BlaI/MecI/CopY family transcriptional regulator [Acidobacteriota bacterium]MBI3663733.1 BlaI/MecI/CopY family transcriptional regulator [Acidobacteriota bacterium]